MQTEKAIKSTIRSNAKELVINLQSSHKYIYIWAKLDLYYFIVCFFQYHRLIFNLIFRMILISMYNCHWDTLKFWINILLFFSRYLLSLKLNNIRNVLMTIWRYLMEKMKNPQFWGVYVEIRYQILLLPQEIKCFSDLSLMHQFKEKASKQPIQQV